MLFSRQEYWSSLPLPSPGDLSDPGIEPVSTALAGGFFTTEPPGKPIGSVNHHEQKFFFFLFLFENEGFITCSQ